jgi:hypothetical protein
LGFEFRVWCMLGRHSTSLSHAAALKYSILSCRVRRELGRVELPQVSA